MGRVCGAKKFGKLNEDFFDYTNVNLLQTADLFSLLSAQVLEVGRKVNGDEAELPAKARTNTNESRYYVNDALTTTTLDCVQDPNACHEKDVTTSGKRNTTSCCKTDLCNSSPAMSIYVTLTTVLCLLLSGVQIPLDKKTDGLQDRQSDERETANGRVLDQVTHRRLHSPLDITVPLVHLVTFLFGIDDWTLLPLKTLFEASTKLHCYNCLRTEKLNGTVSS
ncbi:hypothetical protein CLF_109811 [Clonorchis sinensis]|uniref:Uncharacterized protein n=1 Tax=Clonorchis sinensis TaxID=79923 RepID=G7YSY0_CLOSI|nr:hypothetical protein CLF_109811 [Clonorchis sinensis]